LLTPPSDVTRPIKASKAKTKTQDQANFSLENLYEKILEDLECSYSTSNQDDLKTIEEALSGSDAEKWKEAMKTEMGTIAKMETWKSEELPADRETIGNKWVFLQKQDKNGNIVQFKARLVAQGFSQKPGTDYSNDGTFAPVMWFETLQTLLALRAVNNWKIQ
jgi:Reverse transcriptase (RNA-dependent DNA polymerase)